MNPDVIYNKVNDYTVEIIDGLREPIRLNKASCLLAIGNIEKNRADYATEDAYQRHLAMYKNALPYFGKS